MQTLNSLQVAWDAWRVEHQGPAAIAQRQRSRTAELLAFARQHSRFYSERLRRLPTNSSDLAEVTPVTKSELMDAFDSWVADPAVIRAGLNAFVADPSRIGDTYLGRYIVFTTSGSSGVPAILVYDARAQAVMNALAYVRGVRLVSARIWWKAVRGRLRQAAVFATDGHFLGATMMERRLRSKPWRRHIARLFSALTPLPELVRDLGSFQPAMLGGYPSVVDLLAQEQHAGRLHLRPAVITVAGETLSVEARARIESAFDCPVVESYSCSEATPMALACRRQRLHVNADWFILEPVDADMRRVPPGLLSHSVLLTNLANYVQPIIRYELTDRVLMHPDPCPCGNPLPTLQVEGRTDDVLAMESPDGSVVRLPPLSLVSIAEEAPGLRRVQLLQTGPSSLIVRLDVVPGADLSAVFGSIRVLLASYLARQGLPNVTVEQAAERPQLDPRSGKFRHVWAMHIPQATAGVS